MKVLVINGANLNMLGVREKNIYGEVSYAKLVSLIGEWAEKLGQKVTCYQSNYEGDIVTEIQKARGVYDAIVVNAGAYTHTSIAILDALKCAEVRTIEVHISDINKREDFRKFSYISLYAEKAFIGLGIEGYKKALEYLVDKNQ